jgi:hypothetical protein
MLARLRSLAQALQQGLAGSSVSAQGGCHWGRAGRCSRCSGPVPMLRCLQRGPARALSEWGRGAGCTGIPAQQAGGRAWSVLRYLHLGLTS